jgi:hypothetical protein
LGWQIEPELAEQQFQLRLRLGVAGQDDLSPVRGRHLHVDHLHGGELVEHAARCQTGGERSQPLSQRDLKAIGQEGDKTVRLDAPLLPVEDRPDAELILERLTRNDSAISSDFLLDAASL